MRHIPIEAIERLGCNFCEWRHKKDCPFLNEKGITVFPEEMICDRRKAWIFTLTREYDSVPSFSTWQLDFNKAIAQTRMLKEMWLEEYLSEELLEKEKSGIPSEELNHLRGKVRKAKDTWMGLWKEITRLEDLQVNRETPKLFKSEVKIERGMNLADFGDMVNRAKIVDVVPEREQIEKKKVEQEDVKNGI